MSISVDPELYIGKQETFRKTITESEAIIYDGLVEENNPFKLEGLKEPPSDPKIFQVRYLFMAGIIGGLLESRIPGPGSQCVNIQFEFLGPIFIGDTIETIIELIDLNINKHLATFKIDCFTQNKNQVITGRTVMLVQP